MRFVILLLLLVLTGCQATPIPTEQAPVPPMVNVSAVKPIAKLHKKSPEKPRFVIATIMGLAPETIGNILGTASLIRKEKDVQVWLYQNKECRLHLYFYANDNGDFRLNYVETTAVDISAKNPTVSPNACLDSFVIPDPPPSSADNNTDPQPDR